MSKTTEVWTSVSSQLITAMFVTVDMWKEIHSFIFIHSFNLSIQVRIVEDPGNTEKTGDFTPDGTARRSHWTHTFTPRGQCSTVYSLCGDSYVLSGFSSFLPHRVNRATRCATVLNLTQRIGYARKRLRDSAERIKCHPNLQLCCLWIC